jgi:3D (Asp-Asp-Asp) domain-containing protein
MHKIKAFCAMLGFILAAAIILPLVVLNDYTAVEDDFPHIEVYDYNQVRRYETAAQTVGDFLGEIGTTVSEIDRISYPFEANLYNGMSIRINRAVRFHVITDDDPPEQWTVRYGTTIGQVLAEFQKRYDTPFLYAYDIERPVSDQDILHIKSWRSRYYTEIAEIPYEVIENRTGAVRSGRTHVRQAGVPGEHEATIMVVYIGGHEDSRSIVDAIMLSEPVAAIYDIGTATLGLLTDTTSPDFHYVRRLRMQATAYTACFLCTGKHPDDPLYGITASGRRVEHGIVAVDTSVIPMGTHLYVEGYGFAIAADRGSAIVGDMIDLFMYDHADALRFGRRFLDVWVLN